MIPPWSGMMQKCSDIYSLPPSTLNTIALQRLHQRKRIESPLLLQLLPRPKMRTISKMAKQAKAKIQMLRTGTINRLEEIRAEFHRKARGREMAILTSQSLCSNIVLVLILCINHHHPTHVFITLQVLHKTSEG